MAFVLDSDAVSVLYRDHAEKMLVYFVRRCFDAQLAVDLVAETFARAYTRRDRFRGESMVDAQAWIWAIGRNALTDALRRGRLERAVSAQLGVEPPHLAADEMARVEELADVVGLRRELTRALAVLSDAQREALRLRVVQELDYRSIAERLGVSEAVARARVSRALRVLRVHLDAAEGVA